MHTLERIVAIFQQLYLVAIGLRKICDVILHYQVHMPSDIEGGQARDQDLIILNDMKLQVPVVPIS